MKSTFFFLAMLIFVNCSQDLISPVGNADPALLEIAKNPASEAVFATMAIQLENKGGFHVVLGLLNELVHDSKEQLHAITKIWRGVQARCQVSKIKLAGRHEFFSTYLLGAQRHVRNATQRLAEIKDQVEGLKRSKNIYSAILRDEIKRHAFTKAHLTARIAHARAGVSSLKAAQAAVNNWTPKGRALIQTHLQKVAAAYMKVKEYELPLATEFLERTTDRKVRKRLLEWINRVSRHLQFAAGSFDHSLAKLRGFTLESERALANMIVAINAANNQLRKSVTYAQRMITHGNAAVNLFKKLLRANSYLIKENNQFCHVESVNFHTNQRTARAAIKLFLEIRNYFVSNYRKIHSYIHAKYN